MFKWTYITFKRIGGGGKQQFQTIINRLRSTMFFEVCDAERLVSCRQTKVIKLNITCPTTNRFMFYTKLVYQSGGRGGRSRMTIRVQINMYLNTNPILVSWTLYDSLSVLNVFRAWHRQCWPFVYSPCSLCVSRSRPYRYPHGLKNPVGVYDDRFYHLDRNVYWCAHVFECIDLLWFITNGFRKQTLFRNAAAIVVRRF